jgi:hypothetical protein
LGYFDDEMTTNVTDQIDLDEPIGKPPAVLLADEGIGVPTGHHDLQWEVRPRLQDGEQCPSGCAFTVG